MKMRVTIGIAGLLLATLFLGACNIIDNQPAVATNQGNQPDPDADLNVDADATDNHLEPDTNLSDLECPDGEWPGIGFYGEETCVMNPSLQPEPPTCQDEVRPVACDETPPVATDLNLLMVRSIQFASSDCCVDFTGDGQNDHSFPQLFELMASETVLVLDVSEDSGLGLESPFTLPVLNAHLINGHLRLLGNSFDEGAHPRSLFAEAATVEGEEALVLLARHGRVHLPGDLFVPDAHNLSLVMRNALLSSDWTDTSDPFNLERLHLSGTISASDSAAFLTDAMGACGCQMYYYEGTELGLTCTVEEIAGVPCYPEDCVEHSGLCEGISAINSAFHIDTGSGHFDSMSVSFVLLLD
jgi:hypothetical protein